MTAPTLNRTEVPGPNPTTPVIVKIGGGERGDPEGNPIILDSPEMPFVDQSGATWYEALSTSPGRIKKLTLKDDNLQRLYSEAHSGSNMLLDLKVYFASGDVLELGEVVGMNGSFFLVAKSTNIPFNAQDYREERREWNTSTGPLTGAPIKAEFRQRQIGAANDQLKLDYFFTSANVYLELDFETTT